jgi:hypothetical protein
VPLDKLLKTNNLVTGTPSYTEKASEEFMFGDSTAVTLSELLDHIQALVPPFRNLVFVGHGMFHDLQALQALQFCFPASLSAILDTSKIAKDVFGYWVGSLGKLLTLKCPNDQLHCAGNDANFTLKAFLLLASLSLEMLGKDQDMASVLRQIGQLELPGGLLQK